MTLNRKTESPFHYHMMIGTKFEPHSADIAAELIDRLRFNTGSEATIASRKSIKYGVEQFTINPHPFQIYYCLKYLEHSHYWNVAINELMIHLRYLWSWRYFYKLISHGHHHISDLYKLGISGNSDIDALFMHELPKVHSHKDFIKFMWDVRATLDFDELLSLNHCSKFWSNRDESYTDKVNDICFSRMTDRNWYLF